LEIFFKLYADYCSQHPDSVIKEKELRETNQDFITTLKICESDPLCKGLFLSALLIKPVQRICKYPLFFRELLKNIEDHNSKAYQRLSEASVKLEEVVEKVNEGRRIAESMQRTLEIEQLVSGLHMALLSPTRRYIEEHEFQVKQQSYQIFLFTDLVLVTQVNTSVFSKKETYKLKATISIPNFVAKEISQNVYEIYDNNDQKKKFKLTPKTNTSTQIFHSIEELKKNKIINTYVNT